MGAVFKKLQKAGSVYSPYNINIFNELFYKHAKEELIDELPNIFTKLDLFNLALHEKITAEITSNVIKVTELASGKKMDRWKTFIEINKKRKWRVLLTDFDKTLLPDLNSIGKTGHFGFISGVYSLFDNFSKLKIDDKQDVLLSSYTFDNLWLKNDLHLTKIDNTWYKNLYKLDLSKVGKRIEDIKNRKRLDSQFFKDLRIKTKQTRVDIFSLEHGTHINRYYKNYKRVRVNYAGGLVKAVVSGYKNVLKKGGIFITADMATVTDNEEISGFISVNECIKIKIENYALVKYILEKLGFQIGLQDVENFIETSGIITPVKITDHFVLSATVPFFVYILRTSSNTLYIGQTNNLEKRIKEHRSKTLKSAKYMRYFKRFELVYFERYRTRSEAMKREAELKKWPKSKKEALIKSNKAGNMITP